MKTTLKKFIPLALFLQSSILMFAFNITGNETVCKGEAGFYTLNGYGIVTMDGADCHSVCQNKGILKVPVITQNENIEGPISVCQNENYTYYLPDWPATNFEWNNSIGIPPLSMAKNNYFIEIYTGNNTGNFDLNCSYINTITNCAGTSTLNINILEKPEITTTNNEICSINPTCTLNLSMLPNSATDWIVEDANGNLSNPVVTAAGVSTVILSGTNLFPFPGIYKIHAINPSSFCEPKPVIINVIEPPTQPTNIIGEIQVCNTFPYEYSADLKSGTVLNWTINGGNIVDPQNPMNPLSSFSASEITAIWNNPSSISVNREWEHIKGCKSTDLTVNVSPKNVTGSINISSGNPYVIVDNTSTFILSHTYAVDTYNWFIQPAEAGSIKSGQGTNTVEIDWKESASSTATVHCEVSKCGIIYSSLGAAISSYQVNIQNLAKVDYISTISTSICANEEITFNAILQSNCAPATSFLWDFGDGNSNISTTTNSAKHTFTNSTNSPLSYTVSVIAETNGVFTNTATINITVNPAPNVNLQDPFPISFNYPNFPTTTIKLTPPLLPSYTYQWYFNEVGNGLSGAINGSTNDEYEAKDPPTPIVNGNTANSSEGEYWCVITNSFGCSTETNHKVFTDNSSSGGGSSCTPDLPFACTNMTTNTQGCNSAYATCNTDITNMISYQWSTDPPAVSQDNSAANHDQSPIFYFDDIGIYQIANTITFSSSSSPTAECDKTYFDYVLIKKIADFNYDISCSGGSFLIALTDASKLYPGISVATYNWTITHPGGNTTTATSSQCSFTGVSGGTYTVELEIAESGGLNPCKVSKTFTLDDYPVADFTVVTQPGNANNFKSCEENSIIFQANCQGNILAYKWSFGDGSLSYLNNSYKSYVNDPSIQFFNPNLTITDVNGCTDSKTYPFTVYDNDLIPAYYSPPKTTICKSDAIPGININFSNGTSPYTYQWYSEEVPLTGAAATAATLSGQYGGGTYWVKITDANGCYLYANSSPITPAKVVENPRPLAIINGKQEYCLNEDVELTAFTGFSKSYPLNYLWTVNASTYTSKEITFPAAMPGSNSVNLSVDYLNGGCGSSSVNNVIIHNNPNPPTISEKLIDCDAYEFELSGNAPGVTNPFFNWSNGTSGPLTYINHGGAYRLWLTDNNSCKSFSDITIENSPSFFFWRFPNGCYSFCPDDLPKRVDGPFLVPFNYFEYQINGLTMVNNGGFAPTGSSSTANSISPLIIDQLPPNGNGDGSGSYTLTLEKNYNCKQTTDEMDVSILKDCCNLDVRLIQFKCNNNVWEFFLDVNSYNCSNPFFNVYVLDANTMDPASIVTNLSWNAPVLNGQFSNITPSSLNNIIIKVEAICPDEDCVGSVSATLPQCSKKGLKSNFNDTVNTYLNYNLSLEIIPNPANDYANILYEFPKKSNTTNNDFLILIYDNVGKEIDKIKINNNKGSYKLNTNNYNQAVYYIQLVENNNRLLTKRLSIVK